MLIYSSLKWNFWILHKKEKSPLTQGLNYRSACDKNLCNPATDLTDLFYGRR